MTFVIDNFYNRWASQLIKIRSTTLTMKQSIYRFLRSCFLMSLVQSWPRVSALFFRFYLISIHSLIRGKNNNLECWEIRCSHGRCKDIAKTINKYFAQDNVLSNNFKKIYLLLRGNDASKYCVCVTRWRYIEQ